MEEKKDRPSEVNLMEEKEIEAGKSNQTQIKEHNKIIIGVIIFFIVAFIGLITWGVISKSISSFEYKGVEFEIVKEIAPYRTSVPVIVNEKGIAITGAAINTPYYFYIRNDPRELDKIPFDGEVKFLKNVAIKSEKEFNCDGDGIIGIANLAQLYQVLGAKVIKDQEAECDKQGRYMLLNFVEGNKTEIKEIGNACYEIRVNNCEILKATERFMAESFVEFNEIKNS